MTAAEKYDQVVDQQARENAEKIVDDAHTVAAALQELPEKLARIKRTAEDIARDPEAAMRDALDQVEQIHIQPLYVDVYSHEKKTAELGPIKVTYLKEGWMNHDDWAYDEQGNRIHTDPHAHERITPQPKPQGLAEEAAQKALAAGKDANASGAAEAFEEQGSDIQTTFNTPVPRPTTNGQGRG